MAKKSTIGNLIIKKPIARICWNGKKSNARGWLCKDWTTNEWKSPSGPEGKSEDEESFEHKFGFGFEEWLFDETAKFGEYQYGFLQQFNSGSFVNESEDVLEKLYLYTISPYKLNEQSIKLYVGWIENLTIINDITQLLVYNHFFSNGRLTRMYREVFDIGGKWHRRGLLLTPPEDIFNVKFKLDDVHLLPRARILAPNCIQSYWYKLQTFKEDPITGEPMTSGIEIDLKTGEIFDANGNKISKNVNTQKQ